MDDGASPPGEPVQDPEAENALEHLGLKPPLAFIISLLIVGAVATIGGFATGSSVTEWYPDLDKPEWTPPSWLFGPVWTILYIGMAIAAFRIAQKAPWSAARVPLYLYLVQLVLNLSWSLLFFGLQRTGVALLDILVLDVLVAWLIVRAWRLDRVAAWLLVPYLAWILFATALNAAIWWLNQ